jgi:uncharacterized membrane protein
MDNLPRQPGNLAANLTIKNSFKLLLVFVTGLVFVGWLYYTPPGLLGKADAVGYAACHRISPRSFFIGERQTPFCARCSGMYLGALLGMVYQLRYGKRGGMPPLKISVVLAAFLVAFGFDGANSYLQFFPNAPAAYEPQNWLRLVTGTGIGLGIAALLYPVLQQTIWRSYDNTPPLAGWRQFIPLLALAGLLILAVLSGIPLLLYPLSLFSALSLLLLLTLVYTLVWVMISKRENRYQTYRELWVPMTGGFLTALLQIAIIDAARFWFTGTWAGFNL